jgi:hypothetical protein
LAVKFLLERYYNTIYVNQLFQDGIRDKLAPIVGTAAFKLSEGTAQMRGLRPIVGPVHAFEDAITIQRNCGGDDVCIPDLQLSVVL